MGTDIHTVFQKKNENGKWENIESKYNEDRHYLLFAWLGNVRNGYGFAGCKLHEPIKSLSDNRGFPVNFFVGRVYDEKYDVECSGCEMKSKKWMGEHSFSWLSGSEILDADIPFVKKYGVVDIEIFKNWDGKSNPEKYCGDVSGERVFKATPETINEQTTHVCISWECSPEIIKNEFEYFLDELKRLKDEHGEVRMVFGFDS